MDEINPEFPQTDVALVIGANDVANPAARNQPGSPIYGMPILDVDKAQNVVVLKRSMRPGFAGDRQPALHDPKTVDALRRREGLGREARRRRQERCDRSASSAREHVEAAVSPERAVEAVREAFVAYAQRRVVDAAEGLRARLPGRRLPRDACARRRARVC